MSEDAAAVQFTLLGAAGPTIEAGDAKLSELYEHPVAPDNLPHCRVRGNMIASLDGGAMFDGKTAGLGGAGDQEIFSLMRYAADVIMVGAATVRAENYSGAQVPLPHRRARQDRGQLEVPPIAVITRSGDLDPNALFFTRTEVPPLVLTSSRSFSDTRTRLGSAAQVIDASRDAPDEVDPETVLQKLAQRKLFRVLAEGGPSILGLFMQRFLLDELCVTVAPFMVGGAASRIVTGPAELRDRMRLAHVLSDDEGYLYTRYVRF